MNQHHRAVAMTRHTLAAMFASTLLVNTAVAQDDTTHTSVFKPPVFLVMPGGLTTCSISCPASKSKTDFNARFQTVVPTATSRVAGSNEKSTIDTAASDGGAPCSAAGSD